MGMKVPPNKLRAVEKHFFFFREITVNTFESKFGAKCGLKNAAGIRDRAPPWAGGPPRVRGRGGPVQSKKRS